MALTLTYQCLHMTGLLLAEALDNFRYSSSTRTEAEIETAVENLLWLLGSKAVKEVIALPPIFYRECHKLRVLLDTVLFKGYRQPELDYNRE